MLPNHCEKSSLLAKPRMQNESFHLLIDPSVLSFSLVPSCSSSATVRHFYSMDCDSLIRGRREGRKGRECNSAQLTLLPGMDGKGGEGSEAGKDQGRKGC